MRYLSSRYPIAVVALSITVNMPPPDLRHILHHPPHQLHFFARIRTWHASCCKASIAIEGETTWSHALSGRVLVGITAVLVLFCRFPIPCRLRTGPILVLSLYRKTNPK